MQNTMHPPLQNGMGFCRLALLMFLSGVVFSLFGAEALAQGQGNSFSSCSVRASGDGQVFVSVGHGAAIKSFYATATPALPSGQTPSCSGSYSCTISNLQPGQIYQFTVSGTNGGGRQGSQGYFCGQSMGGTSPTPNPPTGITSVPGNQQLVVGWTPPSGTVSGYKVCVTTSPSSSCPSNCLTIAGSCATNPGKVTQCSVTGLSNGTPYYVAIAAQNGGGYGACSAVSGPFTPMGVPDAPVITGITPSDGKLHIQWAKPNTNGSPITGYLMEFGPSVNGPWSEAPGGCVSSQINLSEPLSCDANPLINGQTYYFRVAARIAGNQLGLWSNIDQGVPKGLPPTANPDQYLMSQGGTLDTSLSSGANQSSVKNNDLNVAQVTLLSGSGLGPFHAQSFSFTAGGGFVYTPDPSFSGDDSFFYLGSNGHEVTKAAKVTITVSPTNLPPISNNDTYKVSVGNTLSVNSALGVLNNDGDPEHHSIIASLVSGPSNGILQNFDPLGGFVYVPNPGFKGTDTFTYRANDGQLNGNTALVSILVESTNHAPVANPIGWSTAQDVPLTISGPGVLSNDTDPDKDALSAVLATSTTHGSVTLSSNGGFKYIPTPGYSGNDSFTYVASDGSLSSSPATVSIRVNAVVTNLPPIGVPDIFYVPQGQTLSVTRAGGVLANDVDPENHPLSRSIASSSIHGTFSPVDAGGFTYVPTPSFTGVDSFTYNLTDGQFTVGPITAQLIVLPIKQKPQANPDAWSLLQDTQIYVAPSNGVLVNDIDPQGSSLKAILLSQPSHGLLNPIEGGGFTYIPQTAYAGQDSFTYKVTNGVLESDPTTVYLNVNPVPVKTTVPPPIANPDNWIVEMDQVLDVPDRGLLINDYAPQGIPLFATPFTQPAHGTLTMLGGGGFVYTPDTGFTGQDFFYYTAIGGGVGSSPALVKITVTEKLVPPAPPAATKIKLPGGTTVVVPPPPGQVPVTVVGKPIPSKPSPGPGRTVIVTPPSNGSATVTPDGGYVYTPNPGYGGPDGFTIATSSGGKVSAPSPISIEVNSPGSDRPPVALPRTYRGTSGSPVIFSNSNGLLQSARDPDGDFLRAIIVTYPSHGYLEVQKNGEFAYYPEPGFTGTDTFSWKANDGLLDSDVVTDKLICTRCSRRE